MVGLDGSDGHLLDRLTGTGDLPHLARLRDRGAFKLLDNADEMSDDSIWASFQFGVPLSDHGRYHYLQPRSSGRMRMAVTQEDADDTFWSKLSARGMRVGVIDIPKCPRPKPLNGVHLADWRVHGRYFNGPQSYPPELADETVAAFGAQTRSWCDFHQELPDDDTIREMLADFLASVEMKRRASLKHLENGDWDLFLVGFKEAHCAGHGLWHLADPNHADYDAQRVARVGDPVGTIYRALDAAVGDLVTAAGSQADVVVFSNSFMQPNGSVLHLQDPLVAKINAVLTGEHMQFRDWLGNGVRALRRWPKEPMCRFVPSNENHVALRLSRRDPKRFARMLEQTVGLLSGVTDADTGLPVFDRIVLSSTDQAGAARDVMPDIVAWCRTNALPQTLTSNGLGQITAAGRRMRPGNHSMGGAVIAAGAKATDLSAGLENMSDFAEFTNRILQKS